MMASRVGDNEDPWRVVSLSEDPSVGQSSNLFRSDTIILVCSLLVMMLIGLMCHGALWYLMRIRTRKQVRQNYMNSLKSLAEHLDAITHTQASGPQETGNIDKWFKPSTHCMVRDATELGFKTLAQYHHDHPDEKPNK